MLPTIFALALFCLILEIFLPGGILGIGAVILFAWGTYEAYTLSPLTGHIALCFSTTASLASLYYTFKVLPNSKFGKQLVLNKNLHKVPSDEKAQYIGQTGIAETDLRPVGKICINSKHFDACSEGDYIPKGSSVKIIKTEAQQLIVELST